MKTKFKFWILLITLSLCDCKGKTTEPEPSFLEVTSKEVIFTPEAGIKIVTVKSSGEFTTQSSVSWCTVPPTGNLSMRVTVSANASVEAERTAEITVTCDDLTDKVTVRQSGVAASVSVKETGIYIHEKVSLDFTLDITANLPVAFELPAWIHEKEGNAPEVGTKIYSFQADALPEGVDSRDGTIVVKSANTGINKSIAIPVKQNRENCILRIATYNIFYEQTSWNNSRAALVNNLIRQHDFDIFGAQEAMYSPHLTGNTSITSDGTYAYTGRGRDLLPQSGEYSAIVYKKERFELLSSGTFWYSATPDVPGKGWDAICCNRICSWGKFRDKETGREFYFFNSHFDHEGATARLESAKLLLSKIKAIAGSDVPVFVTGDFNATPESTPIQILLYDGLLNDSRTLSEKPPYGTLGTATGFISTPSTSRIDFIFVTKDIWVREYGVLNDRPNGQFPSDHDPVLIIAEF